MNVQPTGGEWFGIHISFYDESGRGGEGVKQDQDVRPKVDQSEADYYYYRDHEEN